MPLEAGRCVWEVTAGLIPAHVDPAYTRRWGLTAAEWADGTGMERFLTREAEAGAYARSLQLLCAMGHAVNWTRVEFIWF